MRLMLGTPGVPSLLVSVDDNYDPTNFKFRVINGGWDGTYKNGEVRVDNKYDNEPVAYNVGILTDNQDRLRCDFTNFDSYNDVFDNFNNPNYVAPEYKRPTKFDDMDDDIPF